MPKIGFFSALMAFLISCQPISVTTQADGSADLGDYITFNWSSGIFEKTIADNKYVNERVLRMIQSKVMKEMIFKGFRYDVDTPEILVNIEVVREESQDPKDIAGHNYNYWTGYEIPQKIDPGTLIIELIDIEAERVIWQGIATDALPENPTGNENKIDRVISQVFSGYQNKVI